MSGMVIGGFFVKSYEGTRSHGPEPAGAGGVGVITPGGSLGFSCGDYLALSFMGIVFHGVAVSVVRNRSLREGDEYEFRMLDNRIRLRWGLVFGQWNMETDLSADYGDPVLERPSALDEWWGGPVGFDQGVDFQGGIESEMGRPRPLVKDGSVKRGRMFAHIPPAYWKSQKQVFSNAPMTARQIIEEAVRGAKGGGGLGFVFHPAQSKPVYNVDCNACTSLSGFLQQMADAQGLQFTMDGASAIRFTRKGEGTVVVPLGATVRRLGDSVSTSPTKVMVVGGKRLIQVNNVPMVADWNRKWEKFLSEWAWHEEVRTLMSNAGPIGDNAAARADVAAKARDITLAQYIAEKGLTVSNPADLESEYADNGRWGTASRMDIPVWEYLNSIVFRCYRVAANAELYGYPIRSLKIVERLLCGADLATGDNPDHIVYRSDPLEFYPQSSSFVIAKGQPLDLKDAERHEGLIRNGNADMRTRWSVIHGFSLDAANHAICFDQPVFIDGEGDKAILVHPNRGLAGRTDLSGDVDEGSTYLDLVIPNPKFEVAPAEIKAALVFEVGLFTAEFGVGVRWTSHHVSAIEEHLLHPQDGFSPQGVEAYDGDLAVPDPPASSFMEILYENGQNAMELAEDQTAGLIVRTGVESMGSYERVGSAGSVLTGAIDRVSVRIADIRSGLVEEVDFAKPRPVKGVVPTWQLPERLRNEEAWSGQRDLAREVRELRQIARMMRINPDRAKVSEPSFRSFADVLRKPVGAKDEDCVTLPDPNAQYPERGEDEDVGWKAGDIVWLDSKMLPSRSGSIFGGVCVVDSTTVGEGESETPAKFVSVVRRGTVPVWVDAGVAPGPVFADPGAWRAGSSGSHMLGRLYHADSVPGEDGPTLALVSLGGGGSVAAGPCWLGEIITWEEGSGPDPGIKTGLRGGIIEAGEDQWWVENFEIASTPDREVLLWAELDILANVTEDNAVTLSGIRSADRESFAFHEGDISSGYPDKVIPEIFPGEEAAPGEGKIILPIGRLKVEAGVITLESSGCGHFIVNHCPGNLTYSRRGTGSIGSGGSSGSVT